MDGGGDVMVAKVLWVVEGGYVRAWQNGDYYRCLKRRMRSVGVGRWLGGGGGGVSSQSGWGEVGCG